MTVRDFAQLSVDELLEKRGAIAYAAQMCALESLPMPDEVASEGHAVDEELRRRGVDLQRG